MSVATNWLVYLRQDAYAYPNAGNVGTRRLVRAGTAFRIRMIQRLGAAVYVRSDAVGWIQFANNRFEDANCHAGARVYLSPGKPTDRQTIGVPSSGSLYAAQRVAQGSNPDYWYYARHPQPRV